MAFIFGWREGFVVLIDIPTTILLTLFASYFMGCTINRLSLSVVRGQAVTQFRSSRPG